MMYIIPYELDQSDAEVTLESSRSLGSQPGDAPGPHTCHLEAMPTKHTVNADASTNDDATSIISHTSTQQKHDSTKEEAKQFLFFCFVLI